MHLCYFMSVRALFRWIAISLLLCVQVLAFAGPFNGQHLGWAPKAEAGFWERTGNQIDANNRERAMNKAADEMAGRTEEKSVFGLVIPLVILGGLAFVGYHALASLNATTRKIIIGSVAFVISALVGLFLFQSAEKNSKTEALRKREETGGVIAEISAAASASGESLRPFIYGTDKSLLAGSKNLEQVASANKVGLHTLNLEDKYIAVSCAGSSLCGFMPDKNPILAQVDGTQLLYCNNAKNLKDKKGKVNSAKPEPSNFVLTGFVLHFPDMFKMKSVVQGLVNSRSMLNSSELRFVESHYRTEPNEFTSGKGLSIFWRSKDGGVDLCGNKDYNV